MKTCSVSKESVARAVAVCLSTGSSPCRVLLATAYRAIANTVSESISRGTLAISIRSTEKTNRYRYGKMV